MGAQGAQQPKNGVFWPGQYWFHHVVSLNATISYNVWWEDQAARARHELAGHISGGINGVIDMAWVKQPRLMVACARAFAAATLAAIFGDAAEYARELYHERYEPLLVGGQAGGGVPAFDAGYTAELERAMCSPYGGVEPTAAAQAKVRAAAAPLVAAFGRLPADAVRVEAGDFVDQLALWLAQYNFLPSTELHKFAQSLYLCP
jgi:hypothetical protein